MGAYVTLHGLHNARDLSSALAEAAGQVGALRSSGALAEV